jgi:hypothetical protein
MADEDEEHFEDDGEDDEDEDDEDGGGGNRSKFLFCFFKNFLGQKFLSLVPTFLRHEKVSPQSTCNNKQLRKLI